MAERTRWIRWMAATVLLTFGVILWPWIDRLRAETDLPIRHIIVIYQENHSFDNLYGLLPGADGVPVDKPAPPQVDRNGNPYGVLPPVLDTSKRPPVPDPRFPADLPNRPFPIDRYVPMDQPIPDLVHRFYQHQLQINGGRNDRFVAWSDAGALTMGYYDTTRLPMYRLAREFTVLDHFFQAAFGGSFLNHMWLVCACTPVWPSPPLDLVAAPLYDQDGRLVGLERDGAVTPDGYAVNTVQSTYRPHRSEIPADRLLPPQDTPTIGDRLDAARISWAWYAGGWRDALAGHPDPTFQFHHQPFAYFRRYGDGTEAKAIHLRDEEEFFVDLAAGRIPSVSFIKPLGRFNEHPGYATLMEGQQHVVQLIEAVRRSRYWPSSAIIVTYDENGGFWDHVPPPRFDRWGPGSRVPAIVISPYAKRGFVDHTPYDTTSILKFIEWRFGLRPLTGRDARANNLLTAFRF
jgi:phospholipase C